MVYWAVLTRFWFQNGAVLEDPRVARVTCKKTHFWPFFDPFLNPKWAI